MSKTRMCAYCGIHHPEEDLTPLYEKGKDFILYYCPRCTPLVKDNLFDYGLKLGQSGIPNFFRFGKQGEKPPDSNE